MKLIGGSRTRRPPPPPRPVIVAACGLIYRRLTYSYVASGWCLRTRGRAQRSLEAELQVWSRVCVAQQMVLTRAHWLNEHYCLPVRRALNLLAQSTKRHGTGVFVYQTGQAVAASAVPRTDVGIWRGISPCVEHLFLRQSNHLQPRAHRALIYTLHSSLISDLLSLH